MSGRSGALPCPGADSPIDKRAGARLSHLARPLLTERRQVKPRGRLGVWLTDRRARRGRPGDTAMTMMDFWYDRAIYEMADLNEEATELRRDAAETLGPPAFEQADQEDD